jgi:hypothetical protein
VKSVRIHILALLGSVVFSVSVMAGASKVASDKILDESDVSNAVSGIVGQRSSIIGYQPLTVAGQEVEATYLEEVLGERHGAIILLHDQGEKLEGQGVITPLRHQMLKYGWSTLTLALHYPYESSILLSPSLTADENESEMESTDASTDEKSVDSTPQEKELLPPVSNQQRLKAAITFLQEKDIDRIIFIGHGTGGNLAVEILDDAIQALILISTPELSTNDVFKTMQHPILDLYGAQDLDGIAEAVQHRKVLMKRAENNDYATREIVGANHYFTGLESTLVNSLRGWLKSTFLDANKE